MLTLKTSDKEELLDNLTITFKDIEQAQERMRGFAHHTPVLTSTTANTMTGAELFFKCENLQRVGAFKFRGAYNAIAQFSPAQLKGGVVAFSSGNHAQATALAAKMLKIKAVIIMPQDAPQIKVTATKNYGAEVVFYNRYTDDREAIGRKLAEERGLTLVSPYDDPHVMAGQGTVAKELFDEVGKLDVLLVPVGGGGLLSGCALAAKIMNPKCLVVGVEPLSGNDGQQSFRTGKIVRIDTPDTIADGAQTQQVGELPFQVIQKYVDDMVTVTDAELIEAMKFLASRMKLIVEPTGCLGTAAVFANKVKSSGKKVGIILSGGNIDLMRFASLTQGEA